MDAVSASPATSHAQLKTVDVRGATIGYEIVGAGTAVLCIQGVGVPGEAWRPQVDGLSKGFRVMTVDNQGIGRSTRSRSPLTIEAMASDALAIVDAEGLDRFHVIGHSMGGLIAQHLALTVPSRVKSLALLCTFAATAPSFRMVMLGLRSRLGTRAMRREGMMRMIMPPDYLARVDHDRLAAELQRLFGRDLADQPPILKEQLRAMSRYDARPRLRELAGIPTIVVSGAHDPIAAPRFGRALAAGIPGARFIEFAGASHALPIQCASEVNTLLAEHMGLADGKRQR